MVQRMAKQVLPVQDVEQSSVPGGLVAHWERLMVGQLARDTHAAGEQFVEWPTCYALPRLQRSPDTWAEPGLDEGATHIVIEVYVFTEAQP